MSIFISHVGKLRLRQAKEATGGPRWGVCGAVLPPGPADPSSCLALFLLLSLPGWLISARRGSFPMFTACPLCASSRQTTALSPAGLSLHGLGGRALCAITICDFSVNSISYFGAQEGEYCLRTFRVHFRVHFRQMHKR